MVKVINRVLDYGRIPPVILGDGEDEGGVGGYFCGPGASVLVGVLGGVFDLAGDGGFVEEWEGVGGEVD
ncbi:hypothetical protein PENSUB_6818 [Penicillium subrubescens]|uniref:Uncharacterized protein n=1 Tax=Penicillium subrubescens TaxID=1316194 RepID=A0A1Q5TUD0_9EURO|nr:hypothetical protein PENSUB_6818 [Penicillium subrubescens]